MSEREEEVHDQLVHWAERQEIVRALVLESSRANGAPLDIFSDFDVLQVVTDPRPFVEGDAWLADFAPPLVMFRDAMRTWEHETYTRLVLYEDGTKVDYVIWPIALLREAVERQTLPDLLDWGYRVLLDKDHVAAGLSAPTRTAHIPRPPTAPEYFAVVEEFWWETIYVAKNLWRDDLLPATYSLDVVLKHDLLLRMLEWRVEIERDWAWKPGKVGRGLRSHLTPELWSELEATFVGAEIEENWRALFAMTALFRRAASEVAGVLGYAYPEHLDAGVTAYLQRVRAQPR